MSTREPSHTFDLLTKAAEPDQAPVGRQQQASPATQTHPLHLLQRSAGNRFAQQRLSRQVDGNGSMQPGPAAQAALDSVGGGQPLPASTRAGMELALGVDLSRVLVHNGPVAADAATELGARAFTIGRDIFFGAGQYDPTSPNGRDLLAHELAHTLQPGAGNGLDLSQLDAQPPDPQIPQSEEVERTQAEPVSLEETEEQAIVEEGEPSAESQGETPPPEGEQPAEGEAEPARGGPAAPEAEGGESEGAPAADARPDIQLLMPEPPAELTPDAQGRLNTSQQAMGGAATAVEALPTADQSTQAARGAVEEPQVETQGRAEDRLAEALGARPEPSPEIVELCESIRQSIREKRPVEEDELVAADPETMAQEAGTELNDTVEGDTERVQGSYDQMNEPQQGTPELTPQPIETPPAEVSTPDPNAAAAAPDPIDPAATDLSADQAQVDADMETAGMNSETAQAIQDPNSPVVQARAARGELSETAQSRPGEVLAAQDAALQQASANMASLQEQALAVLAESRFSTVSSVGGQQTQMVGTEAQMREQLSTQARQIFADAQTRVNTLLQPLSNNAMEKWRAGVARLSTEFRESLNWVKAWIDERHSGVGGAILAGWDALTGLPGWVTEDYDRAEKKFGDDICDLIMEISTEVNSVIAACEAIIDDARQQIDALYTQNLPEGLQEWAAAERERMQGQLDGLQNQVTTTQQNFNRNLSREAVRSVRAVQDEVAKLREEAKGLIGKIADAINAFLDDPIRAIINGLLSLVGIAPSSFWALVNKIQQVISDIADDPENFINNLVSAIGQGFQQFFDNILTHLLHGFIDWLLGGLPSVGVQIPKDLSLKSLITFFLQLMGITWPRIRKILVRHIGEQNVALIEKAWSIISTLIEKGPEGIFELIKEQLNPENILKQIMDAAINFLVEALIKNVALRVIALFNPVGAIAQAIELIYKILKWIFENAARIFSFVETIVNGMADIIAGNIGGMAKAVEKALAKLIPPVIDFLASLIGLGDLPDKIVETVKGMQEWVESILERVIGWLVEQGRKLLEAVGLGKKEEPKAGAEGELGAVGDTVSFSGGGESHQLWVKESGTTTTVVVASKEESVGQKLGRWKSEARKLNEKKSEAEGLISQAVPQLDATEKKAYEAELIKQEAEAQAKASAAAPAQEGQAAAPANDAAAQFPPKDQEVLEDEQSLSQILTQLFDLFDKKRDLLVIYAQELSQADQNAQPRLRTHLEQDAERLAELAGWAEVKSRLESETDVAAMLQKPLNAEHAFGIAASDNQAKPAIAKALAAVGMTEAQIGGVDRYLQYRKRLIHEGHASFPLSRSELAKQVFQGDNEATATSVLETEFQTKLSGDKFAHLNREEVRAALEKAAAGAGTDWAAVFATGGTSLVGRTPAGVESSLTLGDVWTSNGISQGMAIDMVKGELVKTISADPNFQARHLGGSQVAELAGSIAQGLVTAMAAKELYFVKQTEIPRKLVAGPHLIPNPNVSASQAKYASIAANAKQKALSDLNGEIHHFVPLYLGGGSEEVALVRALGGAGTEGTAHNAMHQFIDELEIGGTLGVKNAYQLDWASLNGAFPDNTLKIIIGTVKLDGSITYRDTEPPLAYVVEKDEKGIE